MISKMPGDCPHKYSLIVWHFEDIVHVESLYYGVQLLGSYNSQLKEGGFL